MLAALWFTAGLACGLVIYAAEGAKPPISQARLASWNAQLSTLVPLLASGSVAQLELARRLPQTNGPQLEEREARMRMHMLGVLLFRAIRSNPYMCTNTGASPSSVRSRPSQQKFSSAIQLDLGPTAGQSFDVLTVMMRSC